MKRKQKPHKAEVMITMKVTDKNMIDALKFNFEFTHLNLCAFTAIYQKQALIYIEYLSA
jgi:hypothetical protein